MKFSDASSSTRAVLLGRPSAVLPLFLAGGSISLLAQTFPIIGLALSYVLLSGTGRIEAVISALRGIDFEEIGANTDGMDGLIDALQGLLTPEVVAVLLVSAFLGLVVVFVARAVVGAAQVNAVAAAIRDERAVAAGVAGAERDAMAFLLLALARLAAFLLVFVVFGAMEFALTRGSTVTSILGSLALGIVFLVVLIAVYLLFMFVPQAIVIDGTGVRAGIRRSGSFVRHNKARVVAYIIVVIGLFGVFSFVAGGLALLGVSRLSGIILLFGLSPAVSVLKTALYLDADPTPVIGRGSVRGAFRRGLVELRSFLARNPLLFLLALSLFAVGGIGGWAAGRPFTLQSVRPDLSSNVFGSFPIDVFVKLAANNWLVSISAAFAGLGFGVPTLVTLLFNGAIVGIVVGLLPDPTLAIALIAPHGIVEIPGLSVAGALGLHLGGVAWSYVRGRSSVDGVARELVRAYYVLLGLLPVFIVAAFIEAFVTWWVASTVV